MINCNENDNDTIDHINKIYRGQDVDIETNIENKVCLGKAMSQHLRLNKLKKSVAYEISVYMSKLDFYNTIDFLFLQI